MNIKLGFYTFYLLPSLLLCPLGSNSALQLHKLLSTVFLCSFCHYSLVPPYCTSTGLFSTSVINLSLSKILKSSSMMCALAWNGRGRLVALRLFCRTCAKAGMFFCIPLPTPPAGRPPHRPENEACCD